MWERIDELLAGAPHSAALRLHKVELLEARRRRAAGLDAGEFIDDEGLAIAVELATGALLTRIREACDGPLALFKGAEVARDYPGPRLRRFRDLDLLTDDAERAQEALVAAGFVEINDPDNYRDIHHLRPLWWPGLPLVVELHSRPKWVDGVPGPSVEELLEASEPGRVGVEGVDALAPAHHTLVLVAHDWAHEPLGRLGNLIDVAVTRARADDAELAALARRWGCARMWRTTLNAVRAVLEGEGRSAGVALWARHLPAVRERTVLETHVQELLAPVWGVPPTRVPAIVRDAMASTAGRSGPEPWRAKLRRARTALGNAGMARSEHDLVLDARGHGENANEEAG
jgi:hypothetical protein